MRVHSREYRLSQSVMSKKGNIPGHFIIVYVNLSCNMTHNVKNMVTVYFLFVVYPYIANKGVCDNWCNYGLLEPDAIPD